MGKKARKNESGKQPPPQPPKFDRNGLVRCRVCNCTEERACDPPCAWADRDLCTLCNDAVLELVKWLRGAYRTNKAALLREVARRMSRKAQ